MRKSKKLILVIITFLVGLLIGNLLTNNIKNKVIDVESKRVIKFKGYYNLLNQWLLIKRDGKSLTTYFVEKGYQTVAIYGMGELGNRLYEELRNSEIEVKYAIDKNSGSVYPELEIYDLDDDLAEVDVIVVTAVFAFDEIMTELSEIVNYPIVSLEEILYKI